MSDGDIYDENYFIYGQRSGKSLYDNYRWLPDLTIPMCQAITKHCRVTPRANILDFGCARGYIVKALRHLGYNARGVDISEWAIRNADEEVKPFVQCTKDAPPFTEGEFDWIIAKDVLEHVEYVSLTIDDLMNVAAKGLFVVVPLTRHDHGRYVIEEYEKDITHKQRMPLSTWVKMFLRDGWSVEASYRVKGVKDNYAHHIMGNGFLTCRRIQE